MGTFICRKEDVVCGVTWRERWVVSCHASRNVREKDWDGAWSAAYSLVACLSRFTTDHTYLARRTTTGRGRGFATLNN